MNKLIRNEQIKLAANFLNGIAIAIIVVGGLAPIVSFATQSVPSERLWAIGILALACVIASAAIHYAARRILGGLLE